MTAYDCQDPYCWCEAEVKDVWRRFFALWESQPDLLLQERILWLELGPRLMDLDEKR